MLTIFCFFFLKKEYEEIDFNKDEGLNLNFENCEFLGIINFEYIFKSKSIRFYRCKFYEKISFSRMVFKNDFLFEDCEVQKSISFRNIVFNKICSFIDTKFYAIEMQKREKELDKEKKNGKNSFEWLIFKVHGLVSNHSQDSLLALFWILIFSFAYGFISCVNESLDTNLEYFLIDSFILGIILTISIWVVKKEKINNFYLVLVFYFFYSFFSKDFTLYDISNNINPFSIMTGLQELSFLTLIYKVSIAFLIYQFIISIRQNTRRK